MMTGRRIRWLVFAGWAAGEAACAGIMPGSQSLGGIWCIGDSITQSNADNDSTGSPRKSLYDLLTAGGYAFTYTGHFTANPEGLPVTGGDVAGNLYHYHSGISGSVIGNDFGNQTGITQNLAAFWTSGRLAIVKPSVILLMLGTNDINQGIDLADAPARLTALLDAIHGLSGVGEPTVLVASIPPNRTNVPADPVNVAAFNSTVPGIVQNQRNLGRDVHFVDQFTPLDANFATLMRDDKLHTNAAGNDSLAQQWFAKIEELAAGPPGFVSWANGHGVPADDHGDTDHDGIPALIEYALGFSPHQSEELPVPVADTAGHAVTWSKGSQAAADPAIRFGVRISENLELWVDPEDENLSESVSEVVLTLPPGTHHRFARLKVIRILP